MTSRSVLQCPKFVPNIFHLDKCSNCFHHKCMHAKNALDCVNATKKISRCGYLFVAPTDWDFSIPAYRKKRWQRRWFVLFNDGTLTYSIDDYAETIPQCTIDLNTVKELKKAENITGHQYSIALSSDKNYYFKATCHDEMKIWIDNLSVYVQDNANATQKLIYTKTEPYTFMGLPDKCCNMMNDWSHNVATSILNEEPCRDYEKIPQTLFDKIRSPAVNSMSLNVDNNSRLVRGDPDGGCVLNDRKTKSDADFNYHNKEEWLLTEVEISSLGLNSSSVKKSTWDNLFPEKKIDCNMSGYKHVKIAENSSAAADVCLAKTVTKHDNNCLSTCIFTSKKSKLQDRTSPYFSTNLSTCDTLPHVELNNDFSSGFCCISTSKTNGPNIIEQTGKEYSLIYQGNQEENSTDNISAQNRSNFEEIKRLNKRLLKALNVNQLLRNELQESNKLYDLLEIQHNRLKYHIEIKNLETESQLRLFAARIEDLTANFAMSEKTSRSLKQKLMNKKLCSERRRSTSIPRGRESSTYHKEFEEKISELENKIESTNSDITGETELNSKPDNYNVIKTKKRVRRKSLDSASSQSIQMILRLKALEKKMDNSNQMKQKPLNSYNENAANQLKFLKTILITGQLKIKKSLKYFQALRLQTLTENSDKKDFIKMLENCLTDILKLLDMGKELNPEYQMIRFAAFEKITSNLSKIEEQITLKLNELVARRSFLKKNGLLTPQKELELFSERIAFEIVMFGRLKASIDLIENDDNRENKCAKIEVVETQLLMTSLKGILLGNNSTLLQVKNSTDLLVNLLTQRLVMTSSKLRGLYTIPVKPLNSAIADEILKYNIELNEIYRDYKRMIFDNLLMTLDFVGASDVSECLDSFRQDIISQTSESLNFNIIKLEVNNQMALMFHKLKSSIDSISMFNFNIQEDLKFENIIDEAHENLKSEVDLFLREFYSYIKANQIKKMQNEGKSIELNKTIKSFIDVVSTKCLIDARINILLSKNKKKNLHQVNMGDVPIIHDYEELFCKICSDQEIPEPEIILMNADLKAMLTLSFKELLTNQTDSCEILSVLNQLETEIKRIENYFHSDPFFYPDSQSYTFTNDLYLKCTHLIQVVKNIFDHVKTTQQRLDHCHNQIEKYKNLVKKQVQEINNLKCINIESLKNWNQKTDLQNQKLMNLESNCSKLKHILNEHDQLFEKEDIILHLTTNIKNLRDVCSQKDNVILMLQKQTDNLRAQLSSAQLKYYDINVSSESIMNTKTETSQFKVLLDQNDQENVEFDIKHDYSKDSLRERYQIEIDQLRTLCEKRLAAMEISHKNLINDIQEKHKAEIKQLLLEKEQALAEETQATLAALEAMRKAHQLEVQREVSRFKQEFINQFQKQSLNSLLVRDKEEQLLDVKNEILSLSGKYTIKCIQTAALEEKYNTLSQQHSTLQKELKDLQYRNDRLANIIAAISSNS